MSFEGAAAWKFVSCAGLDIELDFGGGGGGAFPCLNLIKEF